MLGITSLATVLVLGWLGYTVCSTIWGVYFGKLSAIPGPKMAAATRLVLVSHKLRGDAEEWKLALHRAYGGVVRVTPTEVSFASGAAWKDIYGFATASQLAKCAKDPIFYGEQTDSISLIVADDSDHGRMRKCFSYAFSDRALREQEPLLQGYISRLISNIRLTASATTTKEQKIDLARQYNFTTFDIMADLAFGEPLGCLEKSDYIEWISTIFSSLKVMTAISEVNNYPLIKKLLDKAIPPSLHEKRKQHLQFSADRVDKRLKRDTSRSDIWHYVLTKENSGLTRGEMYANAGFFMIAGTETSATLLSALTYYLLQNPSMMKPLTQEIRQKFTSSNQIDGRGVLSLKYLDACVNEAFRMHPPVPIGLPRVIPTGGLEICGYQLPQGTSVYVHHLSMYRNPRNFSRPDTFLPQRWLSDDKHSSSELDQKRHESVLDTREFIGDDKSCFHPFSVGPRNCLGQSLALLEIRLILVQVLWHFDLELCQDSRGWDKQRVYHLWETKPLMVTAKPAVL